MLTFADNESERALAAFWDRYVDRGRHCLRHTLTHPRESWQALLAVQRLPLITAAPTGSPDGCAVRRVLAARASYGIPARLLGTAMLEVPADPDDYLVGRRAQTLRRKIRSAERRGLKVRRVEMPSERRDLLTAARWAEQSHANPAYRVHAPDNEDLLDHDLWLTVEGPEGHLLLLAVAPVDGELATLRYFRTLGTGDLHSDARYLATGALVAELAARGVRYLFDTATPAAQTNGLRHFQRMVGFRYARVRLASQPRSTEAVALAPRRRPAPSRRRAPAGS